MQMKTTRRRPLAELIEKVHDTGMSYRDMAAQASRAGHEISHSQLQNYAKGHTRNVPNRNQIAALAAAMGVPVDQVRAAVLEEFLDYVPADLADNGGADRVIVAAPPDLSEDERQELQRFVEVWLNARRK